MDNPENEAHAFHWLVDMLESVEVGLVVLDLNYRVEVWNGFRFRNTRPITGTQPFMFQNLTISPLAGADGSVQKICLMVYDVTDIATTTMALEEANAKLEKLSMAGPPAGQR